MYYFLKTKTITGVKSLTNWHRTLESHLVYAEILPEGEMRRVDSVCSKWVQVLIRGRIVNIDPIKITGFQVTIRKGLNNET